MAKKRTKSASGKRSGALRTAKRGPGRSSVRASREQNAPTGFRLGSHVFLHPEDQPPPDPRFEALMAGRAPPRPRQIVGAAPPSYLEGMVRESTRRSASATELYKGKFCGHGESVMTLFDIVIDGESVVDLNIIPPDGPPDASSNPALVAVRRHRARGWRLLFRHDWEAMQMTLEGARPSPITRTEARKLDEQFIRAKVSIGFEYPRDATTRDCVSWLTIDALLPRSKRPRCIVDAEMA